MGATAEPGGTCQNVLGKQQRAVYVNVMKRYTEHFPHYVTHKRRARRGALPSHFCNERRHFREGRCPAAVQEGVPHDLCCAIAQSGDSSACVNVSFQRLWGLVTYFIRVEVPSTCAAVVHMGIDLRLG